MKPALRMCSAAEKRNLVAPFEYTTLALLSLLEQPPLQQPLHILAAVGDDHHEHGAVDDPVDQAIRLDDQLAELADRALEVRAHSPAFPEDHPRIGANR